MTPHAAVGDACRLWYGSFDGVLSTQSLAVPGYPFGSVVPICQDQTGRPLLLLSHLAQHSRNLAADRRCALTVLDRPEGDIQQGRRLTCIADCHAYIDAEALARYCRHFPNGGMYAEQLGFRLYRLEPRRFHYNGGFATARWFSADRILAPPSLTTSAEQALLLTLETERSERLARLFAKLGWGGTDRAIQLVSLDRWGLTVRNGDRLRRLDAQQPFDDWGALITAVDHGDSTPPASAD
jgi:putative heme iron utilization protein